MIHKNIYTIPAVAVIFAIIGACFSPTIASAQNFATQNPCCPTVNYAYNKPTSTYTYNKPTSTYTNNQPTATYAYNKPTATYTTNKPATSYAYNKPVTSYANNTPVTSYSYNKPAAVTYTTNKPVTAYTSNKPVTSYASNKPVTSYATNQPAPVYYKTPTTIVTKTPTYVYKPITVTNPTYVTPKTVVVTTPKHVTYTTPSYNYNVDVNVVRHVTQPTYTQPAPTYIDNSINDSYNDNSVTNTYVSHSFNSGNAVVDSTIITPIVTPHQPVYQPIQPTYYPPVQYNYPYVALSQIPYTGFDLGTMGNILYWAGLVLFALALGYLAVYFGSALINGRRPSMSQMITSPFSGILSARGNQAARSAGDSMSFVRSMNGEAPRIIISRA